MDRAAPAGDERRGSTPHLSVRSGGHRTLRSRVLFVGVCALAYAGLLLLAWWAIEPTYLPIFALLFLGASVFSAVAGALLIVAWAVSGVFTRGGADDDECGPALAGSITRISLFVLAVIAVGFLLGAVIPWLVQGDWMPGAIC